MGNRPSATGAPNGGPTVNQVLLLQSVHRYPAVSLLANTTPAPRMTSADAARIRALARDAVERLRCDPNAAGAFALEAELARMVDEAASGPTDSAVGVFVNRDVTERFWLPVTVRDRAVIDNTFATRDLVRALHRTPRHVVLVFNTGQARLFDSRAGVLRPAKTHAFPLYSAHPAKHRADSVTAAFLRRVDTALGVYLRLHPAPLILIGPDPVVSTFRSQSKNTRRLAGTVSGNLAKAPLSDLARRLAPVLDHYLHSRQDEALHHLEQRDREGRVAAGIQAAWLAVRHERPEMLAVEEGYFYPARLSDDGDVLTSAEDIESPDVIDDAVDELIEHALQRGVWVALTADGALDAYHRVALSVNPRR